MSRCKDQRANHKIFWLNARVLRPQDLPCWQPHQRHGCGLAQAKEHRSGTRPQSHRWARETRVRLEDAPALTSRGGPGEGVHLSCWQRRRSPHLRLCAWSRALHWDRQMSASVQAARGETTAPLSADDTVTNTKNPRIYSPPTALVGTGCIFFM